MLPNLSVSSKLVEQGDLTQSTILKKIDRVKAVLAWIEGMISSDQLFRNKINMIFGELQIFKHPRVIMVSTHWIYTKLSWIDLDTFGETKQYGENRLLSQMQR